MPTITSLIELTVLQCGRCGITYAVPEDWRKTKTRDHSGFSCPNGCRHAYQGESDLDRAQREARERQAALNNANHLKLVAERARDNAIAERKRLEKRLGAGVCPCCNRTFGNVARHMKTKHKQQIEGGKPPMLLTAGSVQ